jgi:hypothetical protein
VIYLIDEYTQRGMSLLGVVGVHRRSSTVGVTLAISVNAARSAQASNTNGVFPPDFGHSNIHGPTILHNIPTII